MDDEVSFFKVKIGKEVIDEVVSKKKSRQDLVVSIQNWLVPELENWIEKTVDKYVNQCVITPENAVQEALRIITEKEKS